MATSSRLDPATKHPLDKLAPLTARNKAYYLRDLVADGLDALKAIWLARIMLECHQS